MKIIICGSIKAADEIIKVKNTLEGKGHIVEIPEGVKHEYMRSKDTDTSEERAETKIKYNLIRGYYEKMKEYDVVLIVNPKLKGIEGYIGGNTLIEMAFGLILNKKIYCLYPIPEMSYTPEILAMQPIILNGDLSIIDL